MELTPREPYDFKLTEADPCLASEWTLYNYYSVLQNEIPFGIRDTNKRTIDACVPYRDAECRTSAHFCVAPGQIFTTSKTKLPKCSMGSADNFVAATALLSRTLVGLLYSQPSRQPTEGTWRSSSARQPTVSLQKCIYKTGQLNSLPTDRIQKIR